MDKNLYIISGCNGAGKTTASFSILPELLKCKEFVNADEIAKGISPFNPESVSIEAGRIMLERINDLINKGETFAFETTLASKSFKDKLIKAKSLNYNIILLFFWLKDTSLAKERVKLRVKNGGHNIPEEVIERRYYRGIKNLFNIYFEIVDVAILVDNSENKIELIAERYYDESLKIINQTKYNLIKEQYEN
jgi:predicted ABC-type ATPase